jgi:hypothetical protein
MCLAYSKEFTTNWLPSGIFPWKITFAYCISFLWIYLGFSFLSEIVPAKYIFSARHGNYTCNSSYSERLRQENLEFKTSTGKVSKTLSQKGNKNKRDGIVTQVVEPLPSKHEALSLIPSNAKKCIYFFPIISMHHLNFKIIEHRFVCRILFYCKAKLKILKQNIQRL